MAKACGVCDYGDDIALKMPAETLHVELVMPRAASHAKIIGIDYSEAEKMPGVKKVITAYDVDGPNRLMMFQFSPHTIAMEQVHQLLADETIVNWGNVVAMVVADTKDHAKEAAAAVKVEIEQLPEYMSYLEAVMPGADRVHPNMENIYTWQPLHKGNSEKVPEIIDDAPYAVEGSFYSSREPHMSIEGDTIQAYYDEDGLLTVQCKSMTTYFDRDDIAQAVGLDVEQVRVVENPTGGSFGWAMNAASYALAAIACKVMQMPVALHMDYEQFMAFSGKRAPSYTNGRLACDKDGKIIAGEFDVGVDHGYDPALGDDLLFKIARFIFFPYYIPNALGLCRAAVTNHSAGVPYRGYGSPQAYTSGEALVDMLAEQIGMDPFEFRYKNIARSGQTNVNSSGISAVSNGRNDGQK